VSHRKPPAPDELIARLRAHLELLGLTHTAQTLDEQLAWAMKERPAPSALLERVLGAEAATKTEHRVQRRIDKSGLREQTTLESFNWLFQPSLDKAAILELARLDFVRRNEDLLFTGKSGTGKSHLLQAIGLRACRLQFSVRYARCVDLLDDLHAGLADGTYLQRLRRWAAPELLLIDDVGLGQVRKRDDEPTAAATLFNLIDRRHGTRSTAFTSNIKLSAWGRYLGDPTLAVAILDRVVMHATQIDIDGPSYRQHLAEEREKKRTRRMDEAAEREE